MVAGSVKDVPDTRDTTKILEHKTGLSFTVNISSEVYDPQTVVATEEYDP